MLSPQKAVPSTLSIAINSQSFAIDLVALPQWLFPLAETISFHTLTVASEAVNDFIGPDINGNPSPVDDPIEYRGSSDYPSLLPQHALSCTTHQSVTLTSTAGTGFIADYKQTTSLPRNQI
ncbi:hypothetical protein NPIL_444801 [Nephila pilipes]|uniref:Uncharacterized protein n=1 Tax=Nephila pilipes TaxID=299642 RepID=A0A8X6QKS5_NEPPI|nr:hypothetical protein NPIL_615521 [Nephila pilipes]GFU27305.1 hypothetical protein NPIL_444801 [Nephila pilipes]